MSDGVSIIVCTMNRAHRLEACLVSLTESVPDSVELIVVDNGSTDNTRSVVGRFPHLTYVREARKGISHARNAGVLASSGTILVFTDDDVTVNPGWLPALTEPFSDAAVVATGGRILHQGLPVPLAIGRWSYFLELRDYGTDPFDFVDWDRLPVGANMAIRRSVLAMPTPFDPRLGNKPGVSLGNDEVHIFTQLMSSHRLVYCPEALVHHRPESHRHLAGNLRRTAFQGGFGAARIHWIQGRPPASIRARVRGVRSALRRTRQSDRSASEPCEAELSALYDLGSALEELFRPSVRIADFIARRGPRVLAGIRR